MASILSTPTFDGNGDVRQFITKVELSASVKEYTGAKLAAVIASKLNGPALDVYMRMPDDDKKDPEKVKTELKREFERGNRDREEALAELNIRVRKKQEPVQIFAFKIEELVKLAYAGCNEASRQIIVKDNFTKGLHKDMRLALKSIANYASADLKTLVDEVSRLELAGVNSCLTDAHGVNVVEAGVCASRGEEATNLVDEIADKVLQKLSESSIDYVSRGRAFDRSRSARGNGESNSFARGTRSEGRRPPLKCRNCNSTSHLVRRCPSRFCQSCGERGHDSWSKDCPKYL